MRPALARVAYPGRDDRARLSRGRRRRPAGGVPARRIGLGRLAPRARAARPREGRATRRCARMTGCGRGRSSSSSRRSRRRVLDLRGRRQAGGLRALVRFGEIEELTELLVSTSTRARHGRALLGPLAATRRPIWARGGDAGTPVDLTLYTEFGVMPVAGHWHMRQRVEDYLEARSHETDHVEPDVHVLTPDRAVAEWKRLEPPAIGHERPLLHEFFGRDRTCLAYARRAHRRGHGALLGRLGRRDRPGRGGPPRTSCRWCCRRSTAWPAPTSPRPSASTAPPRSWWLLDRLRRLGFKVFWPAWVMCSVPLPGPRPLPAHPAPAAPVAAAASVRIAA